MGRPLGIWISLSCIEQYIERARSVSEHDVQAVTVLCLEDRQRSRRIFAQARPPPLTAFPLWTAIYQNTRYISVNLYMDQPLDKCQTVTFAAH